MAPSAGGLTVLDEERCLRLLAGSYLGRVAVSIDGEIAVLPVNFRLHDAAIVFLSDDGAKLGSARRTATASFEVDGWGEVYQSGWSVLVVGLLEEVTAPDEVEQLRSLPLRAWAPGSRTHVLRLRPRRITGRAFRLRGAGT